MNFLKNIAMMAMVAFAAIAVTACSPDNGSSDDDTNMKVNSSWSVAYAGASEIDGVSYKHTAAVISTDQNPYTVIVVRANEFKASKLEALGELLIQDMYAYLDSYNAMYGTEYVFGDMLDTGSTMVGLEDLLPDQYLVVALGITPEGELSGLYATSKPFEVKEEAPTSLYSEWLGDWVIKGDNNISNNVSIGREVVNRSINLTGWMNLPFSIVGEYSTERNDIIFYAQTVYPNYTFGDGTVADIVLLGSDKAGKTYGLENGSYGLAIAGIMESASEGNQRAIVRYGVNVPSYPKFASMILLADVGGKLYTIGSAANMQIPSFNIMAEIDAPESAAVKNCASPKQYRFCYRTLPTPTLHLCREITNLGR